MKFFAFFSILMSIFLFSGCGKSALLMFDKDENFQRSLQHTQEKQLKNLMNISFQSK